METNKDKDSESRDCDCADKCECDKDRKKAETNIEINNGESQEETNSETTRVSGEHAQASFGSENRSIQNELKEEDDVPELQPSSPRSARQRGMSQSSNETRKRITIPQGSNNNSGLSRAPTLEDTGGEGKDSGATTSTDKPAHNAGSPPPGFEHLEDLEYYKAGAMFSIYHPTERFLNGHTCILVHSHNVKGDMVFVREFDDNQADLVSRNYFQYDNVAVTNAATATDDSGLRVRTWKGLELKTLAYIKKEIAGSLVYQDEQLYIQSRGHMEQKYLKRLIEEINSARPY